MVVWALMVGLFPSSAQHVTTAAGKTVGTLPPVYGGDAVAGQSGAAGAATATGEGSAPGASGAGTKSPAAQTAAASQAARQSGVARSGVACGPGVRQLPGSSYAAPCRAKFTGDNGGATWRGVTATSIKIVSRLYANTPDEQAIESQAAAAGYPPMSVRQQVRKVFVDYFNKNFELYGRTVDLQDFQSNASYADEVRNEGREVACADATAIAQERKGFGVMPPPAFLGLGPFSECSAQQGLEVPIGPYGFPEGFYQKYHPYIWAEVMTCDRLAYLAVEFMVKQLANQPAAWARDPALRTQPRKLGYLIPNVGAYASCIELLKKLWASNGFAPASTFVYDVDPSTMPQQAAQAVAQFRQAGVTTVGIQDFVMTTNLTIQADQQGWGPEWVFGGAGLNDADPLARGFKQPEVDGHLFGLTTLGEGRYTIGADGEAARLYKQLTGQALPFGLAGEYFNLLQLFNMLQSAGPDLTPDAVATGMFSMPPASGPDDGRWDFRTGVDGSPNTASHTANLDVRIVHWNANATAADGQKGAYIGFFDNRRFAVHEFLSSPLPGPGG